MRIETIQARDFCVLQDVTIQVGPHVTTLAGKNGAGKTSVFRALMSALCGKRELPERPVRDGADDAEITVTTDDGMVIHATIKPDRSYCVKVTSGEYAIKAPAAWLADKFGSLDALAFLGQDAARQAEQIRIIAGVDTADLDAERARLYEERRDIGRDAKRLRAAADESTPTEAIDTDVDYETELQVAEDAAARRADALAARRAAEARIEAQGPARDRIAELDAWLATCPNAEATAAAISERRTEVAGLEAQLLAARARLEEAEKHAQRLDQVHAEIGRLRPQLATVELPDVPPEVDVDAARRRLALSQEWARWRRAEEAASAAEAEYTQRTAGIEAIDAESEARLAAASFPVPGLGFDDTGLTLDGVPFAQASQAQRMRVSLAVACARTPRPPLLFVQDAALLDEDSLAAVREMSESTGVQVMIERVTRDPGAVVIEGGRVAE